MTSVEMPLAIGGRDQPLGGRHAKGRAEALRLSKRAKAWAEGSCSRSLTSNCPKFASNDVNLTSTLGHLLALRFLSDLTMYVWTQRL